MSPTPHTEQAQPRYSLADFGRSGPQTLVHAAGAARTADRVCPVCCTPITNDTEAIDIAGRYIHLRCAASRRRRFRR
jgi:hypothetical protein